MRLTAHSIDLLLIKTAYVVEKALFATHGRLVLPSRVHCSSLGLQWTSIRIVTFLVAAEADYALIYQLGLRVLRLDLLNFRGGYSVFLAISGLVARVAAPIADKFLVVHLLAHVASIVMVIGAHVVVHSPMVSPHERVQVSVHPILLHRKVCYLF